MKKGVAYLNVTSFHRLKSETKRLKKKIAKSLLKPKAVVVVVSPNMIGCF